MKSQSLTLFLLLITELLASSGYPRSIRVSWLNTSCGGDDALASTSVLLTYNYSDFFGPKPSSVEITLSKSPSNLTYQLNYTESFSEIAIGLSVQYNLFQAEHGGGNCNCVNVYFLDPPTNNST